MATNSKGPHNRGRRAASSPARKKIRTQLTATQAEQATPALERYLRKTAAKWDVRGWGFIGSRRNVRLVLEVPRLIHDPQNPVELLPLPASVGGGYLKPDVRASFARGHCTLHLFDAASGQPQAAVSEPLAPGSPIVVAGFPRQLCGAALIVSCDDKPFLLTCGHVFPPQSKGLEVEVHGETVARLTRNFLESDSQLDAALCAVTPEGRALVARSSDAPTWATTVHAPDVADGGQRATFFAARSASSALAAHVESSSFFQSDLWNRYWDLALPNLIQCSPISQEGDSGSPLFLGNEFYGLCTGAVGVHSYFTPVASVLARIREQFNEVSLWDPTRD